MGVNMKKIIICLFCLIAFNAHATEMCARRDVTVVPIDATVKLGDRGLDGVEWIWWVAFDFGTVYGISTCLSMHELREITGNPEWQVSMNGVDLSVLPTDEYELQGRYEYYNSDTSKPEYERIYCFCKLTHPMSSQWVVAPALVGRTFCTNYCTDYCTRNSDGLYFKRALFNSVGK